MKIIKSLCNQQSLFMSQQKTEVKNKPIKSLSARNFYKINHNRELSNKKHHTLQTEPNYIPKVKQFSHSKAQNKSSRNIPLRSKQISFLQPQHLYTQNINLKGKVNKLNQQLMLQRVKHTQDTKHLIKMKKQVQVQFDDDKYIDLSRTQSKLIEGVKHQYQKMKQKYEDKCKEYNELLKRYEVSRGEEYRFQCESVQIENKKLRDRFQAVLATHNNIQRENQKLKTNNAQEQDFTSRQSRQSQQKRVFELLGYSSRFVCLQKKVQTLQFRTKQQKTRIYSLRESIQIKNKKISYLNKLLVTKDNEIHEKVTKQRKVSKQAKQLHFLVEQLQTQLKNIREVHQQQIIMIKQKQKVKFQTQRTIFLKCLRQKDQIIQKLDHDLKYLSTIISYIKTGQQPQYKFNPLSKKNSFRQNSDHLLNIQQSLSSIEGINSPTVRQRVKTLFQSGLKDHNVIRAQINTQTLKKTILKSSDSELGQSEHPLSQESANQEQEGLIESRIVKRSYLKYSSEAIRMKQIKKSQIDYFRQELMYRLIFYKFSIDKAKEYLNFITDEISKLSKKQRRWRNHYITVKQARQKLQIYPFELSQQKALLFARYIIEDSTKDDLFYHQQNQIQRSIAKSILRAFVGEYILPNEDQVRKELKDIFSSSGKNLNSALSSLAPSGTISAFKLMEISRGIQVQFSEECKNYILSRLAAKSPGGLNQLNYSLLFQGL